MSHQNINTAVPSDKCLHGGKDLVLSNSESFAQDQKCTQSGSRCRMTSLCNGGSETEVSGECGFESQTSFYDKGWE